jgi:hypothetical protein
MTLTDEDFIKGWVQLILDRVMNAVDMASIPSPDSISSSAKSMAKKAVLDHIKSQLVDDVRQFNIRTALTNYIESRVVDVTEARNRQQAEAQQMFQRFYNRLKEFSKSDPTAQRLMACEEPIYQLMPLPDEHTHAYQQAIRSRALVIAALCGLTHYGYPQTSKEDSTAKQGAAR